MLIWLASYPRSGNTLLRTTLNQSFGLKSWSIYDDKTTIGAEAALSEVVGHRNHDTSAAEFIDWAKRSDELVLAKTHELPSDSAKAIYVVRDGRSAIVSYHHFFQRVVQAKVDLAEVLLGVRGYGTWSAHVRAWALSRRPDTLVLRYQGLARRNPATMARLAKFIGRPPVSDDMMSFAELQEIDPAFFHRGSDRTNIAELQARFPALYNAIHGDAAQALGFPLAQVSDIRAKLRAEYEALRTPPGSP